MNPGARSNALGNERTFRILSYALVFLLISCGVLILGILFHTLFPDWHTTIMAGVALFVMVDRLYTYRQLKSLTLFSTEWAMVLGAQLIVIILVVRLLLSYSNGIESLRNDLSLFANGNLEQLFTPEYAASLLLAYLVWSISRQFLDLIDEIGLDQTTALGEETIMPDTVVPAHQRMVNLIFTLGIALVILTAMTRMNLRTIINTPGLIPGVKFSRFSGAEAGALLYFIFGLALLSLSRLMSLQTHWNRLRIPVSSRNLTKQWGVYSLLFLLILGLIVSLLPSGDSFGFFSLIFIAFGFLFRVLFFIAELILGLALILFSLPFLLFRKASPIAPEYVRPALPTFPVAPVTPTAISELLLLVRSIFLWGALIVIVVFAVVQFTRLHGGILPALRRSRITNWLLLAWQWLYKSMDKTRSDISRMVTDAWQSLYSRLEGNQILPPVRWIHPRSLDPRRKIYFYYFAMIRRGGEQGLKRDPSETPSEYAVKLEKALPLVGEDVDSISNAFVKARYSRQEIKAAEANIVKGAWGRIRRALQQQFGDKPAGK
jgi:hypothetical protein